MCVNRQILHSAFAKVSALSPLTVLLATANICLFLSFSPSSFSRLCCCSSSSFFCFLSFRFYGEIIYVGFFLYAFVLSVLNQRTNERNKRVFNLPKSTKFISWESQRNRMQFYELLFHSTCVERIRREYRRFLNVCFYFYFLWLFVRLLYYLSLHYVCLGFIILFLIVFFFVKFKIVKDSISIRIW